MDWALDRFTLAQDKKIETLNFSWPRLSLKNIELKNIQGLPPPNVLRIQQADLVFHLWDLKKIDVTIDNARLSLPVSEPIYFYGNYIAENLDVKIACKTLDLQEILPLFPKEKTAKIPANFKGSLINIDVAVTGPHRDPALRGKFDIDQLTFKKFSLRDGSVALNLQGKFSKPDMELTGPVIISRGILTSHNTTVTLEKSKIVFAKDPTNPSLAITGVSVIDSFKITAHLLGDLQRPHLELTSLPPLPEERLLIMLATGKSWASFDSSVEQNQLSPALAKDFIDYFVFGGSGQKLNEQLGIKEINVVFDEEKRGIGVKKKLTKKIDLDYAIDRASDPQTVNAVEQRMGGNLQITNSVSMSAERELKETTAEDPSAASLNADDKILLKYQKNF